MYVVIGQHVIKHRTLLNAVDACFKMFYVLDVSYSDRCVSVWEFFESVVYGVGKSGKDIPEYPLQLRYSKACLPLRRRCSLCNI